MSLLFDAALGEARLEDAIARVEAHADEDWKEAAFAAVMQIARRRRFFTADDVWKILATSDARTHEPRAMGAVMLRAAREGVIRKASDAHQKSEMAACHRRPKQVWESLILTAARD